MYVKKLDTLERDIENFNNNITELSALQKSLVEKNHYDSENIKKQYVSVKKRNMKVFKNVDGL